MAKKNFNLGESEEENLRNLADIFRELTCENQASLLLVCEGMLLAQNITTVKAVQ